MPNASPLEVYDRLFPGAWPGSAVLYTETLRCGNERTYWCCDLRQADRLSVKYRKRRRVVLGIALHNPQQALTIAKRRRSGAVLGTIRGCEASVTALPGLWVRIPFGLGRAHLHGAAPPPPGRRQALGLLAAIEQRPSILISIGTDEDGTLYAVWLFDELWRFKVGDQPSPAVAEAKGLLSRLQYAINRLAAERGWWLDSSVDLAAALPVPGCPTGAGSRAPRAVVEALPLLPGDGRYSRHDFEYLAAAPADDAHPWHAVLEPHAGRHSARRIYALGPIAAGCPWICHCRADRATLPEPEVKRAIKLLSRCRAPGADAAELIHEVCAGHPGHDPRDVDKKVARALRAGGEPITCDEISEAPGVFERFCGPCPHFGRIAGPVELDDAGGAGSLIVRPVAPAPPGGPPPGGAGHARRLTRPEAAAGAPAAAGDAGRFIAALEPAIGALGGEATARRLVDALAADPEAFPELTAALERLDPCLQPGERSSAMALGVRLRAVKGLVAGGRTLVATRRTRDGLAWAVRPPVPEPGKEQATS